jgi:hypothetical protein
MVIPCLGIPKRVNPEETLCSVGPIRLPLSLIRLPLRAKKNGWVRLNEVDLLRVPMTRRVLCRTGRECGVDEVRNKRSVP